MPKVTSGLTVSLDGFGAGLGQSFDQPFGAGFDADLLDRWMFAEPERRRHEKEIAAVLDAGAFIMGSNMYGPKDRRESPGWAGWWGDTPPYHAPVFVLTHTGRDLVEAAGGTTFHFVADGIGPALEQAKDAAGPRNVMIMGGPSTVNQYLAAGLVDELWLHVVPVTLGRGVRLFDGAPGLTLLPRETSGTEVVTHIRYEVVR